eukprot:1598260-Prymnesium_polylepis.1
MPAYWQSVYLAHELPPDKTEIVQPAVSVASLSQLAASRAGSDGLLRAQVLLLDPEARAVSRMT